MLREFTAVQTPDQWCTGSGHHRSQAGARAGPQPAASPGARLTTLHPPTHQPPLLIPSRATPNSSLSLFLVTVAITLKRLDCDLRKSERLNLVWSPAVSGSRCLRWAARRGRGTRWTPSRWRSASSPRRARRAPPRWRKPRRCERKYVNWVYKDWPWVKQQKLSVFLIRFIANSI